MSNDLPDYVASAQPVPQDKRIAWYKSTAQTYAGIMLWFVFWKAVPMGENTPGGTLVMGLGTAFVGLIGAGALLPCVFLLGPGHAGIENGASLVYRGNVDLRRAWRIHHARLSDGPAPIRLAGSERVRGRQPAVCSAAPY